MFVVMCGNNQSVNVRELITYIPLTQFEVAIVSYGPGLFSMAIKKQASVMYSTDFVCS